MKSILVSLLLVCAPAFAQSDSPPQTSQPASRSLVPGDSPALRLPSSPSYRPPTQARPAPSRSVLITDYDSVREKDDPANYRIELEVEHNGQPGQRLSLVMAEGSAEISTVDPNPVQIDGNSVPSTVSLSVTLTELAHNRCKLKLFFGRTVPYVSGATGVRGGQTHSVVQQVSVGLDTTLVLYSGQSIVVQETDDEQITITMNRIR